MAPGELTWACSSCGNIHRGLPAIGFEAPAHYYSVPEEERTGRVFLTGDLRVVDGKAFYARCVLQVPVLGHDDTLDWGVWSSLSEDNFLKYQETFDDTDQSKLGPMFGWFASVLQGYPTTLNLRCNVIPADNRKRPHIEFDPSQDHPLIADTQNGISIERAIAFVEPMLHRH
ncbi:MAG: DUF2199 domain-containing protein [Rhodomicrobium sp.]